LENKSLKKKIPLMYESKTIWSTWHEK
jgi:hypothetical protein